MDDARAAGLTIPVLAAVAVFTDVVSAAVLQGLPGLELEPALVDEVVNAPDPIEAGIAAAVAEARKLLTISGIDGVNLSGLASGSGRARRGDQGRDRRPDPGGACLVTDPAHAEFDTLAEWTAEVAADLGQNFYIPAGCRGSGSPAVLDWLIDQLDLGSVRCCWTAVPASADRRATWRGVVSVRCWWSRRPAGAAPRKRYSVSRPCGLTHRRCP